MMKTTRTALFLFLLMIAIIHLPPAFAQQQGNSPRLSLYEEFTGENCSWSAGFNAQADPLLNSNTNKIATIKYFLPYSNCSSGPHTFYSDNMAESDARIDYYPNVWGIPQGCINGKYVSQSLSQTMIDTEFVKMSPFTMNVSHSFSDTRDSVFVKVLFTATSPVSDSMVLRVAIIERQLTFETAPGCNGEVNFESMMRKMLPNAEGTPLPTYYWNTGDNCTMTFKWKLGSYLIDWDHQLAVVAFIQEDATKYIYQTGYSSPINLFSSVQNPATKMNLLVSPNPVGYSASVLIDTEEKIQNANLILYDILGKRVRELQINNNRTILERNGLPSGLYFYRFSNRNRDVISGKIIFK